MIAAPVDCKGLGVFCNADTASSSGADQVLAGLPLPPPQRIRRSTTLQLGEATVRCALYGTTAARSDLAVDQRVIEAV